VLASALRGFRAARRLPILFYVLATTAIVWGAWYAAMFLGVPLMLEQGGGRSIGAYGLVIASYGSTNLLATLVVGSFRVPARPAWMVFGGMALVGGGTALIGLAGLAPLAEGWRVPALCAAAAFGAVGGPMEDVAVAVRRQTSVPRGDQAAVMRAFLVSGNLGMLVAFLIAPALFNALGAAPAVVLCGAAILGVAAVGMARHRHAAA
jgi:hypothetical protein